MLAQRHMVALLGGVLITVISLPAIATEAPKAEAATVTETVQALASGRQDVQAETPSCASNSGVEYGRRCLRLTELPPPPTPVAPSKPSATANTPVAPAAAPARSWLGAVGKRIVSELVGIAEAPYSEGANWRATMSAEIQAKLDQTSKQHASKRLASGS